MPHINRVRVNNVKYNFGTQFYDDFLMRFSCKNTIYDLANGGGKSMLMLLLLQNLIPNCTLDDKQPIEKLFRAGAGNTVIHSMIEWRLSDNHIKNGFKYMTTGFCARKAKDNTLGEAVDLENDNTVHENASVEYFNYCIFYREFNDHDIKNFPLSNGKERITYNGLKTYLRELEKKDFNLEIKIFERKNEYQRFISQYGLYESEWEIIRGINKTEGHVRTYFESNYKTARKVVEDLLIEEIIEKSFNSTISQENEAVMADTLMDIKDQLLELSKRKDEINSFDYQTEALLNFIERLQSLKQAYIAREDLNYKLAASYKTVDALIEKISGQLQELKVQEQDCANRIQETEINVMVGQVKQKEQEKAQLDQACQAIENSIEAKEQSLEEREKELVYKEGINDYIDYLYYRGERDKLKEYIDNVNSDKASILEEIHELVGEKKKRDEKKAQLQGQSLKEEEEQLLKEKSYKEELEAEIREHKEKLAVAQYILENCEGQLELIAKDLKEKKSGYNMLLLRDVTEAKQTLLKDIRVTEEKLLDTSRAYREAQLSYDKNQIRLDEAISEKSRYNKEINENIDFRDDLSADRLRIEKMLSIYGGDQEEQLYDRLWERSLENKVKLDKAIEERHGIEAEISQFKAGKLIKESDALQTVYSYISKYHGNIVKTGNEYLGELEIGERQQCLEAMPIIPYSLVITRNFDSIIADTRLGNMNINTSFVPIISLEDVEKGRGHISAAVFAMSSNKVYVDEGAKEQKANELAESFKEINAAIGRYETAMEVYEEDMDFLRKYFGEIKYQADKATLDYERLKQELRVIDESIGEYEANKYTLLDTLKQLEKEEAELKDKLEKLTTEKENMAQLEELWASCDELETKLQSAKGQKEQALKAIKENEARLEAVEAAVKSKTKKYEDLLKALRELEASWKRIYDHYYKEGQYRSIILPDKELEAKIYGLIDVYENGNTELSDKRKLLENYDIAMEKSLQAIDYKGLEVEVIAAQFDKGIVVAIDKEALKAIKDNIFKLKEELKIDKRELALVNSHRDKIAGAIAEASEKIKEKYGEVDIAIDIDEGVEIEAYIAKMKALEAQYREELEIIVKKLKEHEDEKHQKEIILHDIENILKNEDIRLDDKVELLSLDDNTERQIEKIIKSFSNYSKELYDQRIEFQRDKQRLAELMIKTGAQDLAEELKHSIDMPKSVAALLETIQVLEDVIRCIELEKERVGKSLEEMVKIKESFENQCIQSCVSIKTQIDRLHSLSKITMDEEEISIISLHIPYVKEEMYKERMSKYIDDIVKTSDNISGRNDRIKYIRTQLSWKKLFSVIVTDMNSIRMNLYKRERIKEQSRYLPYEEAVGSTGQSQGIYIQFLVAIINYITNINSKEADNRGLRKVIFIDNPFGAAKDVYIWEPIFKLLRVNNVQLIVPARGATPAITGRFDVNYILGQKLIEGKQQTVVVDYSSDVDSQQLDYTKLDFTQLQLF